MGQGLVDHLQHLNPCRLQRPSLDNCIECDAKAMLVNFLPGARPTYLAPYISLYGPCLTEIASSAKEDNAAQLPCREPTCNEEWAP